MEGFILITDLILNFFSMLFQFIISLVPNFSFVENLVQAKDNFIDFISEFISYTLYVFNVPVLKVAIGLFVGYIAFISIEYLTKLTLKYVTRLL